VTAGPAAAARYKFIGSVPPQFSVEDRARGRVATDAYDDHRRERHTYAAVRLGDRPCSSPRDPPRRTRRSDRRAATVLPPHAASAGDAAVAGPEYPISSDVVRSVIRVAIRRIRVVGGEARLG
jgi:hypothetical protein